MIRRLLPFAVFGFAFLLRMIGLGWGLPSEVHANSYHPDEGIVLSASQQIDPLSGRFTPGFYNYGTLYLTATKVAGDVVTVAGGHLPNASYEKSIVWSNAMMRTGRVLSALSGALLCLFVFLTARRISGQRAGLVASAFVVFAPALVVHSAFMTVDMMGAMFVAATLWCSVEAQFDGVKTWKWMAWAGALAGMAASTKYLGAVVIVAPLVVLAMVRAPLTRYVSVLGLAALTFLLFTPGVLLDTAAFWRDFTYELNHTASGHGLVFVGTTTGFLYHATNLFQGYGLLATVGGIAALAIAVARKKPWVWPLVAFCVVYFIIIGRSEVKFLRYTFPLIPPLAIAVGWAAAAAARRGDTKGRLGFIAVGLALVGFDYGGIRGSLVALSWTAGQDPRDAAAFALQNEPGPVGLASDPWFYTPPLWLNAGDSRAVPFKDRIAVMRAQSKPDTLVHLSPTEPFFDWDVRLLTEDRPPLVVVSSQEGYDPARLSGRTDIEPIPQLIASRYTVFRAELEKSYEVYRVFGADGLRVAGVHDLAYVRPEVIVWKRRAKP